MTTSDGCFLLWRRGELIVATIAQASGGHAERITFEGLECQRLETGIFFDHLVSSDPGTNAPDRQIVGFELFPFPDGEHARLALQDLLEARNASGSPDALRVVLRPDLPCEPDGAQGFEMQVFVNPNGRVVIAIPAHWSEGLAIAFESVSDGAPRVPF
jgi:hypothetical protein